MVKIFFFKNFKSESTEFFTEKFSKLFYSLKYFPCLKIFSAAALEAMDDLGMVQQMDDEVDIAMMGDMDEGDDFN